MKRSVTTISAVTIAIAPMVAQQQDASSDKNPNIIIIYPDDLGYGDLGITGHPTIRTPNLDRMGMEGMRFTNYYSASPASTASRYALLTGRYPVRSGFRWVLNPDSERGIHPKEITLAEALKEQGYATAIFGKWHLGSTKREYLPLQNGFDEYVGLPYSNDMLPPKHPDIALMNRNDTIEMNPDQSKLTKLYTEKAISFINKHKNDKFFIYIPYAMPHTPLYPGEEFAGNSERGKYGDTVEEIDWNVGRILRLLKDEGLEENTIVWFMSDNGPWLIRNEDGGSAGLFKDGKGSTWEGGMRVPCLVQWPKQIRSAVNSEIINAMDVYATCIKLAGGEIPDDREVDGQDISSYIIPDYKGDVKNSVPFYYYGINHQLMAVRVGKWKLHVKTYSQLGLKYFGEKEELLFNLDSDPSEKYDLSSSHPDIVSELKSLIEEQNRKIEESKSFFDLD